MSASPVFAIDPGNTHSAWVRLIDGCPRSFGYDANATVREVLRAELANTDMHFAIEIIECYGMAVGREVFETCRWIGRFEEILEPHSVELMPRRAVKLHLCHSMKANDANVRQALIDRFAPTTGSRLEAQGSKKAPGVLYGVSGDIWAALAVAVTFYDRIQGKENVA